MATVFVLTMEGVYCQGVAGVFSTENAARHHAHRQHATSDGYHTWRIDEVDLDRPIDMPGRKGFRRRDPIGPQAHVPIEVRSREQVHDG